MKRLSLVARLPAAFYIVPRAEWNYGVMIPFLPRDAMHKRGLCRQNRPLWRIMSVCVCLSVRPSVTFVDHVKTNKRIFEIFSPSGSHAILVLPDKTGWRYSDGTPLTGSNAGGVSRNRDSAPISGFSAHC